MGEIVLGLIGLAALAWLTERFFKIYHDESIQNFERNKLLWIIGATLVITVAAVVTTILVI